MKCCFFLFRRKTNNLPEELLRFLRQKQQKSYPSKGNEGLRVSLHNAGNILKKIKQAKSDRENRYQPSRESSNKTREADGENDTDLQESTIKERYIDLALIGFCIVVMLGIMAIFSPDRRKKRLVERNAAR